MNSIGSEGIEFLSPDNTQQGSSLHTMGGPIWHLIKLLLYLDYGTTDDCTLTDNSCYHFHCFMIIGYKLTMASPITPAENPPLLPRRICHRPGFGIRQRPFRHRRQ
jgi:hypothetical protein